MVEHHELHPETFASPREISPTLGREAVTDLAVKIDALQAGNVSSEQQEQILKMIEIVPTLPPEMQKEFSAYQKIQGVGADIAKGHSLARRNNGLEGALNVADPIPNPDISLPI